MKERIKAIRAHFALTQEQFAKRINKTSSFISTVETGRCGLSEETVETICRVFGVREAYLRDGIGEIRVFDQRVLTVLQNLPEVIVAQSQRFGMPDLTKTGTDRAGERMPQLKARAGQGVENELTSRADIDPLPRGDLQRPKRQCRDTGGLLVNDETAVF